MAPKIRLPDGYIEAASSLWEKCKHCSNGRIQSPVWKVWWGNHKEDWRDAIASGDCPKDQEYRTCSHCAGTGKFPTGTGRAVLDFMRAFLQTDVVEVVHQPKETD